MKGRFLLLLLFNISFILTGFTQTEKPPIIFIYDASGSMWGKIDGQTKMEIAAQTLAQSIDQLPEDQTMGLVAYGHRRKNDCTDVEFLVAAENLEKSKLKNAINEIKPLGKTPLAASALQVFEQLKASISPATIILITDGIESCGGDLCAVVTQAKAKGIAFRLHIVGFGLKTGGTEALKCAAQAGEGAYYDAQNADDLSTILQEATQSPVEELDRNFSLFASKNGKPVDAIGQFFQAGTEKLLGSLRTYADTGYIGLPPGNYEIRVKALEGTEIEAAVVKDIEITTDQIQHLDFSFDAGKIEVNSTNNQEGWDAVVNIFEAKSGKRVSSGRTYGRIKDFELDPGNYTIEINPLKIKGSSTKFRMENISVQAKQVTSVNHNFESATLLLGAKSETSLVDAVISIIDKEAQKNVSGGRTYTNKQSNPGTHLLSPGTYEITLKALGDYKGQSDRYTITLSAGQTLEKTSIFNK